MVTGLLAACPPQAPLPLPGFRKLERRMEKLSSFPFRTPCSPWARPFTSPHCSRSCSVIPGLCPPTTPLTLEGPSPLSPDPHPPRPSGTHSWLSVPSAQNTYLPSRLHPHALPQEALPRLGWGVFPKSWSSPPHVHLPASQRHLIPLPTLDARHLRAWAILLFNHGRLSS